MNNSIDPISDANTLDPPGSIAVVGAGALGIEAALYGRFLGYDVTLIEAVAIGQSMRERQREPLPMMPDRCLSQLAVSALQAQQADWPQQEGAISRSLPMTYGQWIDDGLVPLTETDLLKGRIRLPVRVTEIVRIPVACDQPGEDTSEIPLDFRLRLVDGAGEVADLDVEAVILTVGASCDIQLGFEPPVPYFFQVAGGATGNPEQDLQTGHREIVTVFAELAGRADLDLYRPRRV